MTTPQIIVLCILWVPIILVAPYAWREYRRLSAERSTFHADLEAALAQRKAERPANQAAAHRGVSASIKRRADNARAMFPETKA